MVPQLMLDNAHKLDPLLDQAVEFRTKWYRSMGIARNL